MLKKDYTKFIKDIRALLRRYDAKFTEEDFAHDTTFYISTPYGKLRIGVDKFENRQKWQKVITQIENVEYLPDRIRRREHFNKFNGKYMNIQESFNRIVWWLEDYLHELFAVTRNIQSFTDADFMGMVSKCNKNATENLPCFKCYYHLRELCPGNPNRVFSMKEAARG